MIKPRATGMNTRPDPRPLLKHAKPCCVYRGAQPSAVEVPVVSLDEFADTESIAQIDVLKIAVQGAESQVVKGMHGLLRASRVRAFMFEYSHRWVDFGWSATLNLKTLQRDLHSFGFELFVATGAELIPISGSCWSDGYEALLQQAQVIVALHQQKTDSKAIRRAYSDVHTENSSGNEQEGAASDSTGKRRSYGHLLHLRLNFKATAAW